MVKRKIFNLQILALLFKLVLKYPDIRFNQLLFNLDLGAEKYYNEEPERTLYRLKNMHTK
jgi:hypothetical protein